MAVKFIWNNDDSESKEVKKEEKKVYETPVIEPVKKSEPEKKEEEKSVTNDNQNMIIVNTDEFISLINYTNVELRHKESLDIMKKISEFEWKFATFYCSLDKKKMIKLIDDYIDQHGLENLDTASADLIKILNPNEGANIKCFICYPRINNDIFNPTVADAISKVVADKEK